MNWPLIISILSKLLTLLAPVLASLATRNYSVGAGPDDGVLWTFLCTHGAALAAALSALGALWGHKVTAANAAATVPSVVTPAAGDHDKILDLLLASFGRAITEEQYKAFTAVREASKSK
jgi:hypothetical protein